MVGMSFSVERVDAGCFFPGPPTSGDASPKKKWKSKRPETPFLELFFKYFTKK